MTTQSANRQKPASSKAPAKRMRLAIFVMILLAIPIMITAWNQYGKLQAGSAQLNELQAKLDEKNKGNEEIEKEIERLKDPEYLQETIIRGLMNYAKDGETVFEVPPATP